MRYGLIVQIAALTALFHGVLYGLQALEATTGIPSVTMTLGSLG